MDDDEGLGDYAGGLCIVCFDADRSAILAPCGHVAMCRWDVSPMFAVLVPTALLVNQAAQMPGIDCAKAALDAPSAGTMHDSAVETAYGMTTQLTY